ncbi:MAG: hypothetical protein ACOVSW_23185 [Candidatus Kapaibacteriota bacterium]
MKTTGAKKKPFEKWDIDALRSEFGLRRVRTIKPLEVWLEQAQKAIEQITKHERDFITFYHNYLRENVDYWNEEDVKCYFIGPMLAVVNFQSEEYNSFFNRKVSAVVSNEEVGGVVDFVVATGRANPKEPFFFLHEYKKERVRDNDPLGQLLIAMLVAQTLNTSVHPIYGCYVVGRNWFFVVLDSTEYAVSKAFDATENSVFEIVAILKQAKVYIEEILALAPVLPAKKLV